ncbi:MAG: phosphate ABC transporter substrate-binding/OmpA family protein [Myxococcota bacterium]
MAQARLTPVAKGLIVLIILGGAGAAAWHLGLKDQFGGEETANSGDGDGDNTDGNNNGGGGDSGGPLGSSGNPLKVSIVSFHGYAPALLANGKSLTTQPGSIMANNNVNVEFIIQDDIPTLPTIFESGTAHCAWRTSDFWAQEQPNLRNNNLDGRAVMVVDNTQGADAIIAKDPSIRRVEDLVGKRIALLQFTPSHGMTIDAIENSSLTARQKSQIQYVFINADDGLAGVRAALESGSADAAALWDPDLSLALQGIPGSRVIYSTRIATNLIYDVIVCDKRVLDDSANDAAISNFVKSWMEGVPAARADEDGAVEALVRTEDFFAQLARDEGEPFVKGLFSNLVWTGLEDNIRILGLAGGTNHYERVYRRFDGIYREAGALANPNSPVINPQQSFEYKYIRSMMEAAPQAREVAQRPQFEFTAQERDEVAEAVEQETQVPVVTRPVIVNFATGSAELNRRSQRTIDTEMVPLIENHGSAYFEVSGNTDSTGSRSVNQRLSRERAQAVVDYLVAQWEFPTERFIIVGNGSSKPLCDEGSPDEGLSLEDCQARNRATRVAILQRHQQDAG